MSSDEAHQDLKLQTSSGALSTKCTVEWLVTYLRILGEEQKTMSEQSLRLNQILNHFLGVQRTTPIEWELPTWQDILGSVKVELFVNERGEIIILTNNPLVGWRENDFLTLTGDRLRFHVGGVIREFGIPIHKQLLKYMSGGSRVLIVTLDGGNFEPIDGTYLRLYEFDDIDQILALPDEIRA